MTDPRPLVLFDVDHTIGCGYSAPCCPARPGTGLMLAVLHALGYEIRVWSGGGAEHAQAWVDHAGLSVVSGCHDKPDYPMTPESVVAMFGRLPILTVDDDETEEIDGVGFVGVPAYTGRHRGPTYSRAEEAT